jgi:hypothetical protein
MAQTYISLFPEFIPDDTAIVSKTEQRAFYDMMKTLYKLIFDDPLYLVTKVNNDDFFVNRFNKTLDNKPDLKVKVLKFRSLMNEFLKNMFHAGQGLEVKFKKKHLHLLSLVGIDDISYLPAAWKYMATRPGANLSAFTYCLFKQSHVYSPAIYKKIFSKDAFEKLDNWMHKNGYKQYDIYDATASDCKLSLSYINPAWSTDPPNGGYLYKIKHTGIAAELDYSLEPAAVLGLCIPKTLMKPLTESFELMNDSLKEFFIKQVSKCWDCKYCVQTDKTGKRPLAYVQVTYKQTDYKICTYFPGYSFNWSNIDIVTTDHIIELLKHMDTFNNH